ncbi:MAG: phosphoribosylglycinamide formyltransferase [bacterium]|nr:MAG: phosphoribosylglycinamide formyltransferase [bacterium]
MSQPAQHRYAVLVSGRGSNLKAILDAIGDGRISQKPSLVLTDNEDAPALDYARQAGVETFFIDPKLHKGRKAYGARIIEELEKRGIDIVCLAGFMRIIHDDMVKNFRWRMVNIHPSLLPDFPGLEAQRQSLEAGVKESGCTVHFVDEGVDTGPVIMRAKVGVERGDTVESLSQRILRQEHRIYPIVIQAMLDNRIKVKDGKVEIEPRQG